MPETQSAGGIASGTIRPMRFVKIGTDEGLLLECDAGERPIGISFQGTHRSDYVDDDGNLAESGEPLSYYTQGARCWLTIAATTASGDRLMSDADGKGTPTTADGDLFGAVALRDGVAGENIPVEVLIGQRAS